MIKHAYLSVFTCDSKRNINIPVTVLGIRRESTLSTVMVRLPDDHEICVLVSELRDPSGLPLTVTDSPRGTADASSGAAQSVALSACGTRSRLFPDIACVKPPRHTGACLFDATESLQLGATPSSYGATQRHTYNDVHVIGDDCGIPTLLSAHDNM